MTQNIRLLYDLKVIIDECINTFYIKCLFCVKNNKHGSDIHKQPWTGISPFHQA